MSVVKYGIARAGHHHDHPALLEVAHRAPSDVGLADLVHRDRAHHAGRLAELLERVLQGEPVHDGRQHPHVVTGRAVHPLGAGGQPAEDVAAPDHDRGLDPVRRPRRPPRAAISRTTPGSIPYSWSPKKRLAGQLQEHPARGRGRRVGGRIGHLVRLPRPFRHRPAWTPRPPCGRTAPRGCSHRARRPSRRSGRRPSGRCRGIADRGAPPPATRTTC